MSYPEKREGKTTGRWIGEVDRRRQGGARFKQPFATKAEADLYEAHVKVHGAEPAAGSDGRALGPTFADVAQMCRDAGGPKKAKWKDDRDHQRMQRLEYVTGVLGHLGIAAIKTTDLDAIVKGLRGRPGRKGKKLSPGTINRYLTVASAVLRFAVDRDMREAMPKVPWQEEAGQRTHVLTETQQEAVCRVLADRGRQDSVVLIRVLAATGMRLGELYGLKPEHVEEPLTDGQQMAWIRVWKTKNREPRSVPIDPALARSLRALLAANALPKSFLLRRYFHQACETCGYSEELVLHSLRHTTATRWLQKGASRDQVMRLLGHKTWVTSERYTHLTDDDLAQAAIKVSPQRGDLAQNEGAAAIVPFTKRTAAQG